MGYNLDQDRVCGIRHKLAGALAELQVLDGNDRFRMRDAIRLVREAYTESKRAFSDQVFASTGVEWDTEAPGNIRLGVTAHCRCGHVFVDDVRGCAPPPPTS